MRWLATGLIALLLTACASALRWEGGPTPDGHYEVQRGDTLYSIALRHDIDYRDLARWNDIGPDYLIRPGQALRLSGPEGDGKRAGAGDSDPVPEADESREPPQQAERSAGGSEPQAGSVAEWRWPVEGEIVRGFALPDSKGLDIGAEAGTRVRATAPGRVVYSGTALKGYGELIIVKHNETYLSAYGYNRRRMAEEGDEVEAGDVIAEVGTGPAQKSMLHFEIREAGKPVDPLRLLPGDG